MYVIGSRREEPAIECTAHRLGNIAEFAHPPSRFDVAPGINVKRKRRGNVCYENSSEECARKNANHHAACRPNHRAMGMIETWSNFLVLLVRIP